MNKKSKGIHYFFVGGTGIFPFLDLFDFLLKKAIYESVKKNFGKEKADFFNIFEEDFENTFDSSFSVVLYASFQNPSEFVCRKSILQLAEICENENFNLFKLNLRYSQEIPIIKEGNFFDKELISNFHKEKEEKYFISRRFEKIISDEIYDGEFISRAYICGSPVMNKAVYSALEQKLPKEKITLY